MQTGPGERRPDMAFGPGEVDDRSGQETMMNKPTGRQESAKPLDRSMVSVRARQTPEPSQSAADLQPAVLALLDPTGHRVGGVCRVDVAPYDAAAHVIVPCDLHHCLQQIAHKGEYLEFGQHAHEIAGCYLL